LEKKQVKKQVKKQDSAKADNHESKLSPFEKKGMANKPENRAFQAKCNLKCS